MASPSYVPTRTTEAVLATKEEAELLAISPGAPLILIDSTSYLEDDTPVEYYHAYHRGDRTRLEVALVRVRDALAQDPREIL